MSEPLFILGCPRSGTTFLSQLIQFTDYGEPVESHFITKYYPEFTNVHEEVDEKFLVGIVRKILSERAIMQWQLNIEAEEVVNQLPKKSYKAVIDYLFSLRFSRLGCDLWSDKTPHYILNFETIYDLYPNAKYVFIIRDGRDVALSLLKMSWGPNNIYYCAKLWEECNRWSQRLQSLKDENRLFFVQYEDLLDNIEDRAKKLYEFVGVNYPTEEVDKIISGVKSGNYNKWKTSMTKRQIRVFESIAGQTLGKFGYELSSEQKPVPVFWGYIYQLHNFLLRLKFLFVINVIDGFKIKFLGKQPFAE